MEEEGKRYVIEEEKLAKKLGQIIGFHFDIDQFSEPVPGSQIGQKVFKPHLVIETMKQFGVEAPLIEEAERAIEMSKLVKDE